ncbi:MAG: RNA-binding transcriptional accessory protein [Prolixibacteraceae bacterium]|nr:RNA-binding transcriptional accessory protein [Prolixibacteraceae bacterium]
MEEVIFKLVSQKVNIPLNQVKNTLLLLKDGATIPFISRYRKELTGGLDELAVAQIQKEYNYFSELEKRKQTVLKTIEGQGALTAELRQKVEETFDASQLEDIYLPFKPKKRTRASVAKEKGLEPLAKIMMGQFEWDIEKKAAGFVNENVQDADKALSGARDIIAEWISENSRARQLVRSLFYRGASIHSKVIAGKEADGQKYRDYFNWSEPLKNCPSHRFLAIRRAEKEGILKAGLSIDDEKAIEQLEQVFLRGNTSCRQHVQKALADAYKRLLFPSIETEFLQKQKEKSDQEAIRVFGENLRQLLLAPPLGQKRVLAIDPGFRTGCKIVCIDEQGNLLHNETIYPHPPQREVREAAKKITTLVNAYKIEAIAVGNGTAGRETEQFMKYLRFDRDITVFSVNEDGASVYSASKVGREEFPNYDVTVRGAVSIGRRLMDPLAELVKIEPKSIGVGQYQHDVDQKLLQQDLDRVVESCVNNVGVNLNTSSKHLLTYISGLGPQLAQNIVDHRKSIGGFSSRKQLMDVERMGAKSFEQAAGFLRIPGAENPLDNSAVHPESYPVVEKMASRLGCGLEELVGSTDLVKKLDLNEFISDKVGLPTLKDIVSELVKPGRDPREKIRILEFDENLKTIDDLREGMVVQGIVTNITRFGAFVDIGIKENGLVHVSEMTNKYIDDPGKVVKLNQHVKVKVLGIDLVRKRIQLSIKQAR